MSSPRDLFHSKWIGLKRGIPDEFDQGGTNKYDTSPHPINYHLSIYPSLSQNKKWWDMFGWLAIQATYVFQFYWGPPVDTICPSGPSRVSWAHPLINSSGTWLSFGQSLSSAFRCFRRWDVEKLICRYVLDAYIKVNLYIHGLHINICMCVSSKRGLLIV